MVTSEEENSLRILAVDVGQKRYGLAQSDPTQTIASPVGTYHLDALLEKLKEITARETIQQLVVGWPLNMDSQESEATDRVKGFITTVQRRFPGLEIIKIDERFTSTLAQRAIRESGLPKSKRQDKGLVDTIAAVIILQDYLNR
jgi:putative Holliday junction resolvase